jgi:hypothetical protein
MRSAAGVNLIKLFGSKFTDSFFVSNTILELWKHIVDNNEMVYLSKIPIKNTPRKNYEIDPRCGSHKTFLEFIYT